MSGANPQHGVGPERQAVAWCWCYCCGRRLEVFRGDSDFACCGRRWPIAGAAQPRPRHEALEAEVETLRSLVDVAGTFLARWSGRRPKGLKSVVARIETARRRSS